LISKFSLAKAKELIGDDYLEVKKIDDLIREQFWRKRSGKNHCKLLNQRFYKQTKILGYRKKHKTFYKFNKLNSLSKRN